MLGFLRNIFTKKKYEMIYDQHTEIFFGEKVESLRETEYRYFQGDIYEKKGQLYKYMDKVRFQHIIKRKIHIQADGTRFFNRESMEDVKLKQPQTSASSLHFRLGQLFPQADLREDVAVKREDYSWAVTMNDWQDYEFADDGRVFRVDQEIGEMSETSDEIIKTYRTKSEIRDLNDDIQLIKELQDVKDQGSHLCNNIEWILSRIPGKARVGRIVTEHGAKAVIKYEGFSVIIDLD